MNVKFIVNPKAGPGFGPDKLAALTKQFATEPGDFEFITTTSRNQTIDTVRQILGKGETDQIVAIGGDGTLNAVANAFFDKGGIISHRATLTPANTGSSNDFYATVIRDNPPGHWTELVLRNDPRFVDVGLISYRDGACEDRYFLNMSSVGMISEIVQHLENSRLNVPASIRFLLPTIICLFKSKPRLFEIITDSETIKSKALTVTVSKGKQAGNGMKFGLDVELDDGMFEVTIFELSNPLAMVLKMPKIFSGKYRDEPEVRKIKTSRLQIKADSSTPCEMDGELHGSTDMSIELLPKALKVNFPV